MKERNEEERVDCFVDFLGDEFEKYFQTDIYFSQINQKLVLINAGIDIKRCFRGQIPILDAKGFLIRGIGFVFTFKVSDSILKSKNGGTFFAIEVYYKSWIKNLEYMDQFMYFGFRRFWRSTIGQRIDESIADSPEDDYCDAIAQTIHDLTEFIECAEEVYLDM
jgi:hypothetical protein